MSMHSHVLEHFELQLTVGTLGLFLMCRVPRTAVRKLPLSKRSQTISGCGNSNWSWRVTIRRFALTGENLQKKQQHLQGIKVVHAHSDWSVWVHHVVLTNAHIYVLKYSMKIGRKHFSKCMHIVETFLKRCNFVTVSRSVVDHDMVAKSSYSGCCLLALVTSFY